MASDLGRDGQIRTDEPLIPSSPVAQRHAHGTFAQVASQASRGQAMLASGELRDIGLVTATGFRWRVRSSATRTATG
ncbi:hypothetical protein GCM10023176_47610 [Micromonospora coerulea]|uniref:Uncharacterized protein n=1 Tax=Micromonospora coerulea TaxID=47856 RepID=A0ABP8SYG5_9ACTN